MFWVFKTFLCLLLTHCVTSEVFLQTKDANQVFTRHRRANSVFEELKKGDMERECREERCSYEEAREIFEQDEKTNEFWNVYYDGNSCSSEPCLNNGVCKDGIGKYSCFCPAMFQGYNCEIVIPQLCEDKNGGCDHFCNVEKEKVICSCVNGYKLAANGKTCYSDDPFKCGHLHPKPTRSIFIHEPVENINNTANIDDHTSGMDIMNATETKASNSTQNSTQSDSLLGLDYEKLDIYVEEEPILPESAGDVRIVNGQDCEPGDCPWQALLVNENKIGFCGGTILNEYFILSAAHCMNLSRSITVVLGIKSDTLGRKLLQFVLVVLGSFMMLVTGHFWLVDYFESNIHSELSFGTFLGIVGLNVLENRRPMLVASIIFISLGVISCFFCAIVDGIIAAEFIDRRPLIEGRCEFYASSTGYAYDNYYSEVMCQAYNNDCKLKVKSNTCYCCDLYSCESPEYPTHYFEFTGVSSCMDVIHLYRLLWSNVVLNVLGVFLGIVTAAILGAFKDLVPALQTQMSPRPAAPPHILYNPTQHMVTYAGYCPSGQALPAYTNYPLPMQHLSSYAAASSAQPSPDAPTSPSEENQNPVPSSSTNPSGPTQSTSADTSGYVLSPNAPSLYAHSLGPFEKPPPYAC